MVQMLDDYTLMCNLKAEFLTKDVLDMVTLGTVIEKVSSTIHFPLSAHGFWVTSSSFVIHFLT